MLFPNAYLILTCLHVKKLWNLQQVRLFQSRKKGTFEAGFNDTCHSFVGTQLTQLLFFSAKSQQQCKDFPRMPRTLSVCFWPCCWKKITQNQHKLCMASSRNELSPFVEKQASVMLQAARLKLQRCVAPEESRHLMRVMSPS